MLQGSQWRGDVEGLAVTGALDCFAPAELAMTEVGGPVANQVIVVVGRITRVHGVRGGVVVEVYTDEPERRFKVGASLRLEQSKQPLTVVEARNQGNRLIVSFRELSSREAAEAVVGQSLSSQVANDEEPSGAAEFFDRHLIGLAVISTKGEAVGRIVDVQHGAAQDLLVVQTEAGERLVPFVEALVPQVDLTKGQVTIADLPGLLEDES